MRLGCQAATHTLVLVAVLAVVLAASMFPPVAAGVIAFSKITTNGDITTEFQFTMLFNGQLYWGPIDLVGDGQGAGIGGGLAFGDYTITESVPDGWVLKDISCSAESPETTFDFVPGESVIIHYVTDDVVRCTFTNSPLTEAVGGVVTPANTSALVAPWLAVIGLVGCIGTVAIVVRKRRP